VTQNDDKNDGKKARKERVIHTRVPAVLEQELKRLATNLRVPVSNVVRTILQDTLATIDSVGELAEDELRSVAERLHKHRDQFKHSDGDVVEAAPSAQSSAAATPSAASAVPPLAGVVGYQALMLARDEHCTLCGADMSAGDSAYLGIRDAPGPRVLLDDSCLPFSAASDAANTKQEDRDDD
jgi:hypothetical protein